MSDGIGQGKVSEKWFREAQFGGFGIFPQLPEQLSTQERGWNIAYRWGWVYIVGRPGSQNGSSGQMVSTSKAYRPCSKSLFEVK